MNFVNRQGQFHDTMFKELEEFAQHQKDYCCTGFGHTLYSHIATIQVNGVDKFHVEDIRIVFTEPHKVQLKCRVSEMLVEAGLISFKKTDTVKLFIKKKTSSPSKEPDLEYDVTEWFDELSGIVPGIDDVVDIKIMPNKWLYLRADEK